MKWYRLVNEEAFIQPAWFIPRFTKSFSCNTVYQGGLPTLINLKADSPHTSSILVSTIV